MKYVLGLLLFLLAFRLSIFYFYPVHFHNGQYVVFSTTVLEDPKIIGNHQEFSVRLGSMWSTTKVTIVTNNEQTFLYGQEITISGNLQEKLLKNKQVVLVIQNPQIKAKNNSIFSFFGQLRAKITDFCENNFSQPYSGLLVGIIFGVKSLLTDQITRSFRIIGISHIVAASGMNVTLVAGFLFSLLGSLFSRRVAIAASIAGIVGFVGISGFDPSIVRAALMGCIAFSAAIVGRQYDSLYVLFLVAAGMLLWNSNYLIDVGFQLSILATAGIILLKPSLFGSSIVSDDIGTTISAQIATLPILLTTFGQYSLISLLVNVLILWTIPLITIVGGVGILVGVIIPSFGKIIVSLIIPLLWFVVQVAQFFSNIPFLLSIDTIPVSITIGYYLLILALLIFFKKK